MPHRGNLREQSMQHVLVTGSAGFIGSHLCEALLAHGHRVTGMDSFDDFYSPAIKRRNLSECLVSKNFSVVEADIRDEAAVDRVMGTGIDAVVHIAARAGVRPSIEQPLLYQ